MKLIVSKKGGGRYLAGKRRASGESFEVESRAARVFCALGFASLEPEKKATKKKAKKKTAKTTYKTRAMTAEQPGSDEQ